MVVLLAMIVAVVICSRCRSGLAGARAGAADPYDKPSTRNPAAADDVGGSEIQEDAPQSALHRGAHCPDSGLGSGV